MKDKIILSTDPCLGPEGYIVDEMQVGVKMFARYYISHDIQDLVYEKRAIASLNSDIHQAGGNADKLVDIIQGTLERYYFDAFKKVAVKVTSKQLSDDSSKITIVIAVNFGTLKSNDLRYGLQTPFEQHKIIHYSKTGDNVVHQGI